MHRRTALRATVQRLLNVHRYRYRKGGAEAVYLDHLALFESHGWECAEFVMAHPNNGTSSWDDYFPSYFRPRGGWRGIVDVPRFIYGRESKHQMKRIIDDFAPDIVHIHGLYNQLTPSVLGPIAERGIPIVYTVHDFKLLCPAYMFYTEQLGTCERCGDGNFWNCVQHRCLHSSRTVSAVYAADAYFHRWRGSYDAVSAFVMPSRSILEKHREYGFAPEKLHHVPNFFQTTADEPVEPVLVEEMRARYGRYIVYFGRLSPEKGCAHLIEACAAIGLPLLLVGEGPEEARLRELAVRSSAPVTFTGYRSGKELWALIEGAIGVALPSIWYEIAPKSVLEALARGKPVVTSAIGGLPELVEDGVTGFLVEPGNTTALATALDKVASFSEAERQVVAARARESVVTKFSAERYYAAMDALYASLR